MQSSAAATRAKTWMIEKALPLWRENGVDRQRGGFVESLTLTGAPDYHAVRRLRVQARQIYVFSHAHDLGWDGDGDGAALAAEGFDYLVDRGWRADGEPGWVHRLTPSGKIDDSRRDAYDHAFVLLACAWAYRATGDTQILGVARQTLDYLDEAMGAENGGWLEGAPHQGPRRQNPHMHALEAFLALHEATGDDVWLARARQIFTLFETHFMCADTGRLTEYFEDDWRPANGAHHDRYEPGHHAEWVWLLRRYAEASGTGTERQADALYDYAVKRGIDPKNGLLWDEVSDGGQVRRASQRCWPQTELLKARLARIEAGHNGAARDNAEATIDALLDRYLAVSPEGGWMDCFDAKGRPAADAIPASTLYHLMCAFAEADRVLNATNVTNFQEDS